MEKKKERAIIGHIEEALGIKASDRALVCDELTNSSH